METLVHSRINWLAEAKATAIALVKGLAIALSVAAVYLALCVMNPFAASGSFGNLGIIDLSSLRIANGLRLLFLVNPWTAIGCSIGSQAFNLWQGKALVGLYWALPTVYAGIYLFASAVSRRVGRSFKKDFAIAAAASFIAGSIGALNVLAVGWVLGLKDITFTIYLLDVLKHMFTVMVIGYPMLRIVELAPKLFNKE